MMIVQKMYLRVKQWLWGPLSPSIPPSQVDDAFDNLHVQITALHALVRSTHRGK